MLQRIAFLLTFAAALSAWARPYGAPGAAYDAVFESLSSGGTVSGQVHFLDGVKLSFGNTELDPDVWFDNDGTAMCFTTTNTGAGAGGIDGDLFCYTLGANLLELVAKTRAADLVYVTQGTNSTPAIGSWPDRATGTGWFFPSTATQAWSVGGATKLYLDDTVLALYGNDLKNADDIYSAVLAADTLPRSTLILPQHAYAQSTTAENYIGSNLILGGSTGRKSVAITAAGSGGNTIVITSNDSQVGAVATVTTYTSDAGGWTCSTETDAVCSCNLYAIIIGTPVPGWTVQRTDATCSDGQLFFQPDATTWLVDLAETGATFVLTERADGSVLFANGSAEYPAIGAALANDGSGTGITFDGASDKVTLISNGNGIAQARPGQFILFTDLNASSHRVYNANGALNLGALYTGAGTGVTGATHFGEDSGNVSFWAQGKGYFEDTANIVTAKGALTTLDTTVESVTFAANPGDASKVTTGTAIPDGADLAYVTTRVVTLGTNCAGYSIGDGADVDLWGADIAVADTTTSTAADHTATWSHPALADQEITITGTNGAGVAANCFDLVVAITAHFTQGTAATSD